MKLVVITSRFPYPVEKGDKLRAYHQLRQLSKRHEIVLIALSDKSVSSEAYQHIADFCSAVEVFTLSRTKVFFNLARALLNGLPLQVGYFYDRSLKSKIQDTIIHHNPDHIYAQLIRTAEYVRALPFNKTLDYMDVFSIGMEQRARKQRFPLKWLMSRETRLLRKYEASVYKDFDHHCIISEQDKERLPISFRTKIAVVSNGVDTSFFKPQVAEKKYDFVFVGNMGYRPNIEAAEILVRECMPIVWKTHPNATLLIAGARPARQVLKLAGPNVTISGWMNDIREAYASARIFAAPISSGIGQQNKILEAMAMGIPCITTGLVNNAIGAPRDLVLMVADGIEEFCQQMNQLLEQPERQQALGREGQNFVAANFSWNGKTKVLHDLFMQKESLSYSI